MKTYTVNVKLKEGGTKTYSNVSEYDHANGELQLTLTDGSTVVLESHEFSKSDVKENAMNETNEKVNPINS